MDHPHWCNICNVYRNFQSHTLHSNCKEWVVCDWKFWYTLYKIFIKDLNIPFHHIGLSRLDCFCESVIKIVRNPVAMIYFIQTEFSCVWHVFYLCPEESSNLKIVLLLMVLFFNGEKQECLPDLKQWGYHIWDESDVPVGLCHDICIASIAELFCGNADWNLG
jgi:hypothetical protein